MLEGGHDAELARSSYLLSLPRVRPEGSAYGWRKALPVHFFIPFDSVVLASCWLASLSSISVCYGKAITAEQAKNMGDKKLAEALTDTLRQMQTKSRVKQGKKPYDY